jgi:H+/Cl- antiporter ClcA
MKTRTANRWSNSSIARNLWYLVRWTVIAFVIGGISGFVGGAFGFGVQWTSGFFAAHHWMLAVLPFLGLLILGLYHVLGEDNNRGTNAMLDAVHGDQPVRATVVPAVFFGSLLTHLGGGSAGREGAALQMGGGIGSFIGRLFRLDKEDMRIAVMCGMAGVFAALFGTPMAASIFAMEIVSVGVIYYAALVPCVFSAFFARYISIRMGLAPTAFRIGEIPHFDEKFAVLTVILGLFCAVVAIAFCMVLTEVSSLYARYTKNRVIRVLAGGILIALFTLLEGSFRYNNTGANLIVQAMQGEARWQDFILKTIFTAVTLEAGFKGGEIVPAFSVGACFGCVFARILGLPAGVAAACGMLALFAGVTNCPITALLIGFEMFGYGAMPFFVITVAVSFTFSGYYSLYSSQNVFLGKIRAIRLERRTGNRTLLAMLGDLIKEKKDGQKP